MEIKFRGKRVDNGGWVYGYYFETPLTDENSGTKPDAGWYFLTGEKRHCISVDGVVYVVDPATIGQFSGICNLTGHEIYKGDVLCDDDGYYLVEFTEGRFVAILDFHSAVPIEIQLSDALAEVIGNIHDNPELLND